VSFVDKVNGGSNGAVDTGGMEATPVTLGAIEPALSNIPRGPGKRKHALAMAYALAGEDNSCSCVDECDALSLDVGVIAAGRRAH
jgi:hypothetical protein